MKTTKMQAKKRRKMILAYIKRVWLRKKAVIIIMMRRGPINGQILKREKKKKKSRFQVKTTRLQRPKQFDKCTLCKASINSSAGTCHILRSQNLYGVVIAQVKMSGDSGVSLKTDIGNMFLYTGLKGPTVVSDIQYPLNSASLAANRTNDIGVITRKSTPSTRYLRIFLWTGTKTRDVS